MRNAVPGAVERARRLRRNQTGDEGELWWHLRARQLGGAKFRRQFPIGRYVADFCCVEVSLVTEVDGGRHAQETQNQRQRSAWLEERRYRVMRFWNNEVLAQTDAVLESISSALCRSQQ